MSEFGRSGAWKRITNYCTTHPPLKTAFSQLFADDLHFQLINAYNIGFFKPGLFDDITKKQNPNLKRI